ncbi:MAG: M24 family metallopeptidase [Thiobacillus sp.]
METRTDEHQQKLNRLRDCLPAHHALRLRGIDWFAWLLAGAANGVLLAAEKGVAEIFVSATEMHVLTDDIEARRLQEEELSESVSVQSFPWAYPQLREDWVTKQLGASTLASDHPTQNEVPLPVTIAALKLELTDTELRRYAEVGRLAAEAMTEVLSDAKLEWSEFELAGAGAAALLARGLEPALILAAGARRLPMYRHPLPSAEKLGSMAMLVFCARGKGLYANLTRFISFGALPARFETAHHHVQQIEAQALSQCRPGVSLAEIYTELQHAYQQHGYPNAIVEHHQGGLTGYQAREVIARPDTHLTLKPGHVLALNPSVPGAKIEDTFYVGNDGLHNLTYDVSWPHTRIGNYLRPEVLQR